MRAPAIAACAAIAILTPARAVHANSFLELLGGVMIPVEDSDWTNYVESGPKLAARVGSVTGTAGGMLSVDWSPLNTDAQGWSGLGSSVDIAAHRFRVLVMGASHIQVGPNLVATARLGAGIDIAYVSVETNFFGTRSKDTDTDSGLALEAGGGIWFQTGSLQLGAELGIPLAFHADDSGDDIDINDYASFDLDLLFGVRLLQ